jgi:hypothetical protein
MRVESEDIAEGSFSAPHHGLTPLADAKFHAYKTTVPEDASPRLYRALRAPASTADPYCIQR